VKTEGFVMPHSIHIERPGDGYILDLKFEKWSINPDLPGNAFELQPPAGARSVTLKEKGRAGTTPVL
jgi:outer membrane lipoprotein-sorting protein